MHKIQQSNEYKILKALLGERKVLKYSMPAKTASEIAKDADVKTGSVYATLNRMEDKGYVKSKLEAPISAPQYNITEKGNVIYDAWQRIVKGEENSESL